MPEGLGDHLRRGGRSQKLAAAAGAGAGPAAQLGGLRQSEFAMSVAGADRLDLAGVLALARRQGHAAGHKHAGQVLRAGEGHHHRGKSLVAGGDPEYALAAR